MVAGRLHRLGVLYIKKPHMAGSLIDAKLKALRWVLENKYYFDWFNENVLARGSALLGKVFWKVGDQTLIDGVAVNGSADTVGFVAGVVRRVQTGFLYSYAFWMVIGLAVMLGLVPDPRLSRIYNAHAGPSASVFSTWLPIAGGLLDAAVRRQATARRGARWRWIALATAVATFLSSLPL